MDLITVQHGSALLPCGMPTTVSLIPLSLEA